MIRILDMLITGRELDYSITDIADQAGIGRATFYRMMNRLLKNKIIISTRKLGNMQLYRINAADPFVNEIISFYDRLLRINMQKYFNKQKSRKMKVAVSH